MSNVVETLFSWLGFGLKTKVCNLEKRHNDLKDSVQFKDVCARTHDALNARFDRSDNMQKEMRDDVKELLKR